MHSQGRAAESKLFRYVSGIRVLEASLAGSGTGISLAVGHVVCPVRETLHKTTEFDRVTVADCRTFWDARFPPRERHTFCANRARRGDFGQPRQRRGRKPTYSETRPPTVRRMLNSQIWPTLTRFSAERHHRTAAMRGDQDWSILKNATTHPAVPTVSTCFC